MSFYDRIPGYWEAVAAESAARDAAFLDLPQLVCGIAVRPLTLRDYLRLSHARSPFIRGGRADRSDVAFLLWHQSTPIGGIHELSPADFALQFDAQDLGFLCAGVAAFIDAALSDRPSGSGTGSASPYSMAASFIHAFRRAYPGTGKDEVLDTPLDQLWQLERCIRRDRNPSELFSNPISDRAKGLYLKRRQEEVRAAMDAKAKEAAPKADNAATAPKRAGRRKVVQKSARKK